jgi:hypothetical protein
MRWSAVVAGMVLGVLFGCGADTVVAVPPGAGGGSSTSSTSTAGGSGGEGGLFTTTSSGGGGSGGSFEGCPITPDDPFYVRVNGDGPQQELFDGCGWPTPTAQLMLGGKCQPGIKIAGCDPDAGIVVTAGDLTGTGTTGGGTIDYVNPSAQHFGEMSTVEVVIWSEVGSTVTGSFSGTVAALNDPSATLTLDGTFFVCRIPNLPPCP